MEGGFTTREEYLRIRKENIIDKLYRGDDNLPLETKEEILMAQYPGQQFSFHTTRLDENGRNLPGSDGHTRFSQRVVQLEAQILSDMGLFRTPLC